MPVRKGSVWVDIDVTGALRALRGMPRDASRELRAASKRIVQTEVPRIKAAASARGAQARAAAKSVRPASDRIPAIAMGGRRKVTKHGGGAGSIAFGAEAGSTEHRQFPKPASAGRWFWDTLGRDSKDLMREWGKAYDDVVRKWGD